MRLPRIRIRVDDAPLAELYGDREPYHFSGADPARGVLSGVSVFGNDDGPHWHYVGFGIRERGPFPFELSFRLAADRVDDVERAPAWPVRLLEAFARHAVRSRRPFGEGHYLCLPEAVDPDGAVRCGALVPDPQLGDASFLQIVGLHERELRWISGDGFARFLGQLGRIDPLFITAPSRAPLEASHAEPGNAEPSSEERS